MANRFAKGTFTWDTTAGLKWSLTSGGAGGQAVPTNADDVFMDGNTTGNITVSGTRDCLSYDGSGFTSQLTGASTGNMRVSANIKFGSGQTMDGANVVATLIATTTGKTITGNSAALSIGKITMNGVSGGWTQADALNLGTNANSVVTVTNGAYSTGGFALTCGSVSSTNANTRTVDISNSTVTVGGQNPIFGINNSTGLTFTSTGSLIKFAGTTTNTISAVTGQTFNNIELTGSGALGFTAGASYTFADIKCNEGTQAHTITCTSGTFTVTTLTLAGTAGKMVTLNGNGGTISCASGTITASYCIIKNSTAAGGAVFIADGTCIDGGGNTGWLFGGAIAFDAASNSGYQTAQGNYSWNHTCTGNFLELLVGISMLSVAGSSVSSITYGGVQLTFVNAKASVSGAVRAELWRLTAPPTGTNSIAVTLSTALDSAGGAISLTNVDQETPLEGTANASATNVGAADATVGITTVVQYDWAVSVVATTDTAITVGTGQTQRSNVTGTLGSGGTSTKGPITTAGADTEYWTNVAALATWSIIATGVRPYSTPVLFAQACL